MRRWWPALLVAFVLLGGPAPAFADRIVSYAVHCTATLSHVAVARPTRIGMVVQNVGTIHANVGQGTLGITLHVGSSLALTPGYKGGLECQTQPGSGTTVIEVLEELE